MEVELKLGLPFDLIIQTDEALGKEIRRFLQPHPKKSSEYRAKPYHYWTLLKLFKEKGFRVKTSILSDSEMSEEYVLKFNVDIKLRDYQKQAVADFYENEGKGVIILPTAAGKTIIGLKITEGLKQKTLVIVPTINLINQWIDTIRKYTDLSIGMIGQYGDNVKEIKEITVTTYASARQNINNLRHNFGFLLFDEVHHLPAEQTLKIAEGFPARYRLGLTATIRRADSREQVLDELVGPQIRITRASELAEKGYIADFAINTVEVDFYSEERKLYNEYIKTYKDYLKSHNIQIRSPKDFQRYLIFRVNKDPEAKKALDAHRKARNLAFSSQSKIAKIGSLLEKHQKDHVIIFSEFNSMVYKISKTYLIPFITHETKSSEREEILMRFKEGNYTKLCTGKVLDEGWDVKRANIGIIVSGTSQSRQFIQRLGRLLRPKERKTILYELITPRTLESKTAKRRKKSKVI